MTAARPDTAYARILKAIEDHGRKADVQIAGLKGEITGLGKEIVGMRSDLGQIRERVGILEAADDEHGAPTPTSLARETEREIEEGLPFRKGWARMLGLSFIGLGIAGGLKGALTSLIDVGHAMFGAFLEFAHLLVPPPTH